MAVDASNLVLRRFDPMLEERGLDDVLEYACSDWAEILCAPFEKIDQIREIICGLEEASGLNGYYIVFGTPQNYIKCADCSFSISDLIFQGTITYNVTAQTITEARNTLRMSSVARLIKDLQTDGPWSGRGTAFQSSLSLGNQQIDSMFSFSPTIIFSLGADANTNAPVSSTGGAILSFNDASVDLNYFSDSATNANNWQPAIAMTYPGFKNDAKVNFAPIMITDVRIQMNVLKGVLNSYSAVTSQLSIGFNGTYSEIASGTCGAHQLSLKSYVKSQSNAVFNGSPPQQLASNIINNPVMCYNVPQYFPTADEISSLAQVGGDFCTSYVGYHPPITTIFTGTVTSLLSQTTEIATLTSTTIDISTSTITETLSTSLVVTVPVTQRDTVYVGGGSDSLNTALGRRSEPSSAPQAVRRDVVPTPALVTTWESDKISYACSLIATGTGTTTFFSSTTTTYTDTSTISLIATQFVGVDGPVASVTTTSTRYNVTSMSSSTTTLAEQTTITRECPLQTEVACFRIKGHGVDLIEGLYLGTGPINDRGLSVFGANAVPDDGIVYLTDSG